MSSSETPDTPPSPIQIPPWTNTNRRINEAGQGVLNLVMTTVLVVIAFAAGWFGNGYVNRGNVATGDQQLVLQAWNLIDQQFVVTSAISQKQMAYAAITAMVNSLGDTGHSRFETPEEYAAENQQLTTGQAQGIGVLLGGGGSQPLRIEAIFPNSPASKSTLKVGDEIVGVNGTDVRGQTIDQVRPLILGKNGTSVTLTVIRPSVSPTATLTISIVRGTYTVPSVVSYIIPGVNIADIGVLEFTQDADSQLKKALKDAEAQHVAGIVLDLRDNPGGFLQSAQDVSSEFIPAGKIVLLDKTRTGQQTITAHTGGLATNLPLVVLVNNGTASAAEITAGAITVDRPGVHLVGEPTFGTGTILSTFLLADGSALVLGTEEWLLPNGQSIYHKHLNPDQPVTLPANAATLNALAANEQNYTLAQVQHSGDTQLLQGIKDLTGQG
jgi:carboxyl-terminal processing protease